MTGPTRPAPLSREQLRLWTHSQVYPGDTAYVIRSALRFPSGLAGHALTAAVERLLHAYPVLTWSFEPQGVLAERRAGRPDTSRHMVFSHAESEVDAERQLDELERVTTDLRTGPLFRVVVLSLGPADTVVCLLAHHIVVDAWSTELLWRDLATLYNGGEFASTEQVSYDIYARQQEATVPARPEVNHHADVDVVRRDYQVPQRSGPVTRRRVFTLPPTVSWAVDEVASRHGVTPFIVLLTAFGVAVRRYDPRVERLAVTTHVSTRLREDLADTVGFFIRTLPIVLDFGAHPATADLLTDVCGQLIAMLDPHAPDLDGWKAAHGLAGHLDRNPLGELCFQQLTHDPQLIELGGARGIDFSFSGSRTDFRLSVTCVRDRQSEGRSIAVHVAYDATMYSEGTIETLYAKLVDIAEELVAGSVASASRLGRGVSRRAAVIGDDRSRRGGASVWAGLERFEGTDRIVVSTEDGRELTMRELLARARRIAGGVQAATGPGDRVEVLTDDRLNGILATLACWRAGRTPVHLDATDAPGAAQPERWDLDQLDIGVILTDRLSDPRAVAGRRCLSIEAIADGDAPLAMVPPPTIAYLIATSGTTGRSVWGERSMAAVEAFLDGGLRVDPDWCVIQTPRLTYEPGLRDSIQTLYSGAELFLGEGIDHDPVGALARAIELGHGDAILAVVPSILHAALVRLRARHFSTRLRVVRCVGEPVPRTTALLCRELLGTDLVVDYGTSEAAMVSLSSSVRASDVMTEIMPLGTPVPPSRIKVVDEDGQPVDRNMLGELTIAGPHVVPGYIGPGAGEGRGRPGLTRDAEGRPCHRTGDLGYVDDAGVAHWVARTGPTVKVRGRMVDLLLIRRTLESIPGVAEACAYVAGRGVDARLMAVFCVEPGAGQVDEDAVRAHLYQQLGARGAPSRVIQLARLPRAGSGKIRPADLPLPSDGMADDGTEQGDPPRTTTEARVADCFAEVLGGSSPPRLGDFFALGGHSLDAIRLADLLSTQAHVELAARAVFGHPTVAGLATLIDRLRQES